MPLLQFVIYILVLFSIICVHHVTGLVKGQFFDRIAIFVFENVDYDVAIQDPNFASLAKQGVLLTNYDAVAHPCQPNYIALVAANTFDVVGDHHANLGTADHNIVDLLENGGISWKAYMEDYPGNCYTKKRNGNYVRKHNPFISFDSIKNDAARCAKIVNAEELSNDIENNTVPQYVFYTPNMLNDGHDSGVAFAGQYIAPLINKLLNATNFSSGTLVVIVFDEADKDPQNHIYAALLGPPIKPGTTDNTKFTHYSIISTIEKNWNLGNLGYNDVNATSFNFP